MQEPLPDNGNRPSLADAVNALMADPSVLSGAFEALKKSGFGTPAQQESSTDSPANEEIEKKEEKEEKKPSETETAPVSNDTGDLIRNLSPMLSMLSSPNQSSKGGNRDGDRRAALLVALRPYLSESRREAIDYIVKISQVSELIKNSGRS